ncbi:MAG: excinuclease ABC subunit UvrC [Candidatus Omnitrophica bacterium]|nr:excinuclease ABC subunit UvrC [Candidatus Omnitrophota bacterium]MCM8800033.1 excinuclease ABC subunit UvrC [Candidatus Omnitrophota bacterium]
MELKEKIKKLPSSCGVYIFKDKLGRILYIGKAKDLKRRVSSYFVRYLNSKTQAFISKVEDLDYILTSSAAQAQLLEANLIKENQPPYNISLRDDKSFPFIRITDEKFPRIYICRKKKKDTEESGIYFGPYPNVKLLKIALKSIRKVFGFRSCKRMPKSICLYGRLKLCPCPCAGKIDEYSYKEIISEIILFLNSKYNELLDKLSKKMQALAKDKRFEEAALIRDQIEALSFLVNPLGEGSSLDELEELKNLFNLKRTPERIEAFDISSISGKDACGSMVSFYRGSADKNNYRRFRIKTVEGIDDYGMLKEIINRRYSRLIREKKILPDLIIIDGGKSHLKVAKKELEKLSLDIPIISIAKREELIYTLDRDSPLRLNFKSLALKLIQRIRNEAHRFAISYHHLLRKKKLLTD